MSHIEHKIHLRLMLYISEQIKQQEELITDIIESEDTSLISEDTWNLLIRNPQGFTILEGFALIVGFT